MKTLKKTLKKTLMKMRPKKMKRDASALLLSNTLYVGIVKDMARIKNGKKKPLFHVAEKRLTDRDAKKTRPAGGVNPRALLILPF